MVHVPRNNYGVSAPIVIPANSDLQLVGDPWDATRLRSEGPYNGTILIVEVRTHTH